MTETDHQDSCDGLQLLKKLLKSHKRSMSETSQRIYLMEGNLEDLREEQRHTKKVIAELESAISTFEWAASYQISDKYLTQVKLENSS